MAPARGVPCAPDIVCDGWGLAPFSSAPAFDFDTGALGVFEGIELFYPHARPPDPQIAKAGLSNTLSQGLGEFDVACGDDAADALGDVIVIDDLIQAIIQWRRVVDGKIDIDAHGLVAAVFMAIDADLGIEAEIADEDVADGLIAVSDMQGRNAQVLAHGYSLTATSAVCHARCWPPSTAIS